MKLNVGLAWRSWLLLPVRVITLSLDFMTKQRDIIQNMSLRMRLLETTVITESQTASPPKVKLLPCDSSKGPKDSFLLS